MKTIFFALLLLGFGCKKDSGTQSQGLNDSPNVPIGSTPETPSETPSLTWTEEFMTLVNSHRLSLGKRALIHRNEMRDIALVHSQDMANKKVAFGHSGFSARCSEAREALGGGNWCAENVAMGQKSPEAVFNSWMNSSGHRANMESEKATHMGFGYAKSSSGTYYWTQLFLEL